MSLALSLATMFTKPIADKVIRSLTDRKDGALKFEKASAAMASGLMAVEALKRVYGKDFLSALNEVLGVPTKSSFSYEAGTQTYIRLDGTGVAPIKILRAEININLDRMSVLDAKGLDLRRGYEWGYRRRMAINTAYQNFGGTYLRHG